MKRKMLFFVVIAAVLLAGCDPFGTSETKAYITGRIYTDSTMTEPYEGATVVVQVDPDSVVMPTVSAVTNADGYFFLEVPFYPGTSGEGVEGFGFTGTGRVGLMAYAMGMEYEYRSFDEDPFTITAGDTLTVWDVPVTAFKPPSGGGGE